MPRDENRIPVIGAISSTDSTTLVVLEADATNKALNTNITNSDLDIRDLAETQDSVAIYGSDDGGTTMRLIKTDSGGSVQVDFENTTLAVTNAGTFAVQEDGAALTALQLIDDTVYVDDADWTDDTSKHLLVGGLYQSSPQTITDGDVAPFNMTVNGALHTAVQNTVTVDLGSNNDVVQPTHDNFNANVNLQVGDADVDSSNAVPTEHSITGIGDGVKTVTTAGTDEALAGSTACKKVDIQALTDNTGTVAVGASGVDATLGTGTGIVLYPGDTYSLEIDNLSDIYVDSTVNGEGVRYVYYT